MNVEDLLRETLADMADEQAPPPPERFLPRRVARRRGAALAAAVAVVALAAGGTVAVRTLSPEVPVATRPVPERAYEVTIAAGSRTTQVYETLSRLTGEPAQSFARAAKDGRALGLPVYAKGKLEGFVHPGTYRFAVSATPSEILAATLSRFGEKAEALGVDSLDVVIVASLVQAESPTEADMPKVARVIHNRLARDMPLSLDSPVLYALGEYRAAATLKDTKLRSPYNTYRHRGLPPGPISNPGEAALRAALHPADGTWLYFVATKPGVLEFATTQKEYDDLVTRIRPSR
ncbi:endolytic transglycosylase MltG [Nonomuraea sp. NPDC050790]|uniref:endolytic transglycosylase MltG n=1 Tax=Nonomuraea sp. NPDC050790 TaxID=3364371 RepID=UPI0037ADB6B3